MKLSKIIDSNYKFRELTQVDLGHFIVFFRLIFFSQSHHSKIDLLGIEVYNLFWFTLLVIIMI